MKEIPEDIKAKLIGRGIVGDREQRTYCEDMLRHIPPELRRAYTSDVDRIRKYMYSYFVQRSDVEVSHTSQFVEHGDTMIDIITPLSESIIINSKYLKVTTGVATEAPIPGFVRCQGPCTSTIQCSLPQADVVAYDETFLEILLNIDLLLAYTDSFITAKSAYSDRLYYFRQSGVILFKL